MSRGRVSIVHTSNRTSTTKHDWIGYLINITKALESAGDLMPFPFIGEAVRIVVSVLEAIQASRL